MNLLQYFQENPGVLLLFITWILFWKGMALWKAARAGEKGWFIAILVVNLVGLLEIFYIYLWPKLCKKKEEDSV